MVYGDMQQWGGNPNDNLGQPVVPQVALSGNSMNYNASQPASGIQIPDGLMGQVGDAVGGSQGGFMNGFFGNKDDGANWGNIGKIGSGLETLGNIWNAYQQTKMAKESFNFQKQAYAEQLGDSRQVYNTSLEGRARARFNTEGGSQEQADQYVNNHAL